LKLLKGKRLEAVPACHRLTCLKFDNSGKVSVPWWIPPYYYFFIGFR
jgi:hypothetical protein